MSVLAKRRFSVPPAQIPPGTWRGIKQFTLQQRSHVKHPIRPPRFEEVEARREAGLGRAPRNRRHGRPRGR